MGSARRHPHKRLVHGYRVKEHPLYITWSGMMGRCHSENHIRYKDYGGRGIFVCERWLAFENFANDMWPKPFPEATIERKNNNLGYNPENCTWATQVEQGHNCRIRKDNTSGCIGVVRLKNGAFNARYDYKKIRYNLGVFNTVIEAIAFRDKFIELFNANDPFWEEMINKENRSRRNSTATGIKYIYKYGKGFAIIKRIDGKNKRLGSASTINEAVNLLKSIT